MVQYCANDWWIRVPFLGLMKASRAQNDIPLLDFGVPFWCSNAHLFLFRATGAAELAFVLCSALSKFWIHSFTRHMDHGVFTILSTLHSLSSFLLPFSSNLESPSHLAFFGRNWTGIVGCFVLKFG
ncbi:hypothetical protein SLA2020_185240 [Shorea laevis]